MRRAAWAGLADRSSRPVSCPHQMPAPVEARIVGMRRDHPGWGPSRIVQELERAAAVPLPGRSAVYRKPGPCIPSRLTGRIIMASLYGSGEGSRLASIAPI